VTQTGVTTVRRITTIVVIGATGVIGVRDK
jgi:hypothetical protein